MPSQDFFCIFTRQYSWIPSGKSSGFLPAFFQDYFQQLFPWFFLENFPGFLNSYHFLLEFLFFENIEFLLECFPVFIPESLVGFLSEFLLRFSQRKFHWISYRIYPTFSTGLFLTIHRRERHENCPRVFLGILEEDLLWFLPVFFIRLPRGLHEIAPRVTTKVISGIFNWLIDLSIFRDFQPLGFLLELLHIQHREHPSSVSKNCVSNLTVKWSVEFRIGLLNAFILF